MNEEHDLPASSPQARGILTSLNETESAKSSSAGVSWPLSQPLVDSAGAVAVSPELTIFNLQILLEDWCRRRVRKGASTGSQEEHTNADCLLVLIACETYR